MVPLSADTGSAQGTKRWSLQEECCPAQHQKPFKMLRQVEKLPVWTGKNWECTPPCAGRRNDVTKSEF